MTRATSVLYLEAVAHVSEMTWLVTGSGIPAVLDELERSAIIRQENGHPPDFIAGIRDSVKALRKFHNLV